MATLGQLKLPVRNTQTLLSPDTRMCHLVYGLLKSGKTSLAGSLDVFTKAYRDKPTLIIACEATEGGGTMCLSDKMVDYVVVSSTAEMDSLLSALRTDTHYGGVVWDNLSDYVKNHLQPKALTFPSREKQAIRTMGVPDRGDYQAMGEFLRIQLMQFIQLSNPKIMGDHAKDLVATALLREKTTDDGRTLTAIQPDLPGAMATTAGAVFQTVSRLYVKVLVNPTTKQRMSRRLLQTTADSIVLAGDRMRVYPDEVSLTTDQGVEVGFKDLYETLWIPKIKTNKEEV